jgi:carboxymethylenebutenolidase
MCFDADASPPIADNGVAVTSRDLTLVADDGNEFLAFEAMSDSPDAGVIILPDVRGLYGFYKELAKCVAQAGHAAVAIDYFGRTEGLGARDDEFDFWPHVEKVTDDGLTADVAAAVSALRAGGAERRLYTIGFCFGGSNSWHQAAKGHGLAGAVGFYGSPTRAGRPLGAPAVVDRVADMECPVLGLMGGDDPSITPDDIAAFEAALAAAGVAGEMVVYPDAPHSFFDRSYAEYAEAAADAWHRVLRFIDGEQPGLGGR